MKASRLVRQNLTHYWRTNLAVVLGVATAVAVLAGALLVGDSVRASLRDLVVQRLGDTDQAIAATGFFREQLADDVQSDAQFATAGFAAACPLIALEATVTHEPSRRVGSAIKVYGVDERFWRFHKLDSKQPPRNREVLVSEALARELQANPGNSLVVRVQKPSEIPAESLHSKKDDLGSTLRLIVRDVLDADSLGEFSLQPQQGAVRAVFVPLKLLQEEIAQPSKVNLILLSENSRDRNDAAQSAVKTDLLDRILKDKTSLEDFGITLRVVGEPKGISVEHDSRLLSDSLAQAAREAAGSSHQLSVLSYLANSISVGDRSIPYSLVTAIDEGASTPSRKVTNGPEAQLFPHLREGLRKAPMQQEGDAKGHFAPILLNEWAAQDLGARPGDVVSLAYYLWHEDGRLETKSAQFRLEGILPIQGVAADKDLVPTYPGITGTEDLSDWDPPFPVDLKLVRQEDEDYWDKYRTTPKVFIPLATGQSLWQSRFGKLTSLRVYPAAGTSIEQALDTYRQKLRAELDPKSMGFTVMPVRSQGLNASRGATDFGEYFLYFSFFLVISALLLTALFFKLGIEQRLREIGVLQAVGFPASKIRSLFLGEGLLLAVIGSLIGLLGALAYGELMMYGLRTWWVGAVGTTMLSLHVSPLSLILGAAGGIIAAIACVAWTLRSLKKQTTRSLLTGTLAQDGLRAGVARPRRITALRLAIVFTLPGVALLVASSFHLIGQTGGFFGGGMLLLVAALCFQSVWLRRGGGNLVGGAGWWAVARLGFRNATYRPARSVVCIALIASAAFIIVSVDAFRREGASGNNGLKSGSGGFPLQARSVVPLVHDVNSSEGRAALNLSDAGPALANVNLTRFRERPGDDASCLNLYQPQNPRILGATEDFIKANRFAFNDSIAPDVIDSGSPWLLLNLELGEGVVPVIADATSLNYVLHLQLGDEFVLNRPEGPIRLRIVGALADSIFQSELVMSEENFLRLFPQLGGYSFFLIDAPQKDLPAVSSTLEDTLSDYGFDVVSTGEKLASFHRVENTYLSTFQMLGGLGLLLGTLGMAAVLLRNVLERRRELALLRAVGYNSSHFTLMVVAENAYLLFCGLVIGTVCALLAILPVFLTRSAQVGSITLGLLLAAVLVSGLTASIIATWAALRSPLIPALRAE